VSSEAVLKMGQTLALRRRFLGGTWAKLASKQGSLPRNRSDLTDEGIDFCSSLPRKLERNSNELMDSNPKDGPIITISDIYRFLIIG
jgi:hypothetical protein